MAYVAEAVCPENKTFHYISLSRRASVHTVEEWIVICATQVNDTVQTFLYLSIAFDDRNNAKHNARLLIYVPGMKSKFYLSVLLSLWSPTGEDLYERLPVTPERHKLS
jgi:hypothetical protein